MNGGSMDVYCGTSDANCASHPSWEWCGYFDFHDWQGDVLFTTGRFNGDGSLRDGSLYVTIGTVDNLVVAVRNSSLTADPGVANNDFTNSSQNVWNWMCVGYDGPTKTVHVRWPQGGTATFTLTTAPLWSSASYDMGEGNFAAYGYGIWNSATGGDNTFAAPTNPVPGGSGGSGGPGGTTNCSQVGPISGSPKFQWCYPQLGCNNFDTGWDIGADFAWLGCVIEQVVLGVVGSIANVAIDLVVPDFGAIQTEWTATNTTLQGHVPSNYVAGGLSAIPGAFGGAHTTAGLSITFYGHAVTLDWHDALQFATPYRGLMAGFVYLSFAVVAVIRGRQVFEQ
jgi:hypothetical protein